MVIGTLAQTQHYCRRWETVQIKTDLWMQGSRSGCWCINVSISFKSHSVAGSKNQLQPDSPNCDGPVLCGHCDSLTWRDFPPPSCLKGLTAGTHSVNASCSAPGKIKGLKFFKKQPGEKSIYTEDAEKAVNKFNMFSFTPDALPDAAKIWTRTSHVIGASTITK